MNPRGEQHTPIDPLALLAGGGEMGERTRAFDWSSTPVGAISEWPQSLKTLVRTMLDSRYAMWLGWGPELTFFYNDAYAKMTLGPKHPWALGKSTREVWPEIWDDIGPRAESVLRTGQATWDEGLLLFLERRGFPEETYHTFSYSPVPDDQGGVGGLLCVVIEDTDRTIGERRLRMLRELAARTTDNTTSVQRACETAARTLSGNPRDLPFVLLYLLGDHGLGAELVGATGLQPGTPPAPANVALDQTAPWPFWQVAESGRAAVVEDVLARFGPLVGGAWPEPVQHAVVLPMARPGQSRPGGFLVAGISPRLVFSDGYRGFLDLLAGHVATAVANARAYEEERRRAEALLEIDRAKTTFFSNVSHEFRTPLTLMLGPIEDLLTSGGTEISPAAKAQLQLVNRNGARLLRLVNTLLDFSRIEAGRVRAVFEPTDLAAFTTDLASNFRSACERAGLRLIVDCPPLSEPVFVDREMWEKVVLNMLSNAFKFTFEGEISVSLRQAGGAMVLCVRDTGTGIPQEEMPRLFERFHRVENVRARTHEGSGIGLALVQDLVKLHGGSIAAESEPGAGTAFTVSVPLGTRHLPADQIRAGRNLAPTTTAASAYVEEALRWLPEDLDRHPRTGVQGSELLCDALPDGRHGVAAGDTDERPRLVLAEDNADMRQYLARLLSEDYVVEAVSDGAAALSAIRQRPPSLVLTDVMMPGLTGFELLRELRGDPRIRSLPVIMLSARAGEESRVEGLEAGADDYLVKPFSARELLARVSAHVQMARLRREASESLRISEERLRMALTAARMVAWEWNPREGTLALSDNVAEVAGLASQESVERWLTLVHGDDAPRVRATVAQALEDGNVFLLQFRMTRPDTGALVWLEDRGYGIRNAAGQVVRLVGVFLDITARKEADERERKLMQEAATANAQFRAFFEQGALFAGILRVDGTLVEPNRLCLDACGYAREEVVGKLFWQCPWWNRSPELMLRIQAACERAAAGVTFRSEMPYFVADGTQRIVDLIVLPITDDMGRVVFLAPSGTDITDRKRAEEALTDADRRKDEFLATLAHELRNPLAPIRNGLEIMHLAAGDRGLVEQARLMMERQLGQMVHLVDDLLDLSRVSRGKIELRSERIELAKVVQHAIETSRPAIEQAGHELTINLPPGPIFVEADITRLSQVFANLLNNAAKYTDRGGRVELTVERQGSDAVVSVRDNGVGIPPHMITKVFEMFTQVDRNLERSQGGLGIGLSIVKRLVEMHGGSVEAKSAGIGKGSEFVVRLPTVLPAAWQPVPDGREAAPATDRRRVLVVDDNRDAALSLAMMLKIMGNEAQTAHDGLQALDVMSTFQPDLVLLDIGMPKLNGYETARRIRQQPWGQHTTLVALTGWGQEEDRRKSQEAGFDFHLVKPIEPAALKKILARLQAGSATILGD